jgi:outer membrane protein TolC
LGKTSYLGAKLSTNELLFDARRAALRQAQALRSLSEAERRLAVNDLLNNALSAYWEWLKAYQGYQVISDIIRINEERLRFVRIEWQQGNRPAIDTSEVLAQLLNFRQQQSAAWLEFQNQGVMLSNFLWLENARPFQWNSRIIPDTTILTEGHQQYLQQLVALADVDITQHPKMESFRTKIDFLETERRLKAQYLIPKLSVNANMLSKGYEAPGEISRTMLENNYKLGIDFSVPLLMREARAGYRGTRLKIMETSIARDQEQLSLENKVRSYYNEVLSLHEQIRFYENAYQSYLRLYQGEQLRFEVGESTLFLLNSRENKVLETRQKLIELQTKWHKSFTGLLWAAGQFAGAI